MIVDDEISCYGGNDGKLTAMVSGGTPGYTFMWSNGANTAMNANLSAGTYTVTITDANGCTCTKTVTLNNPPQLNCSITINNHVSCYGGNDGKLTANAASGGTPGYTFAWSNGANTAMISNLSAGSYTVTVTDTEGCICVSTATITEPIELECWITVNQEISCTGGNDGKLTVTAGGGTPGYTFAWSNGANTAMISNLTAGTYTVTVTDANGCTCTKSMTLNDPPQLNCSITINNHVSCYGGNDGKLNSNCQRRHTRLYFAWSNGANTAMINNLSIGTYTVTVTDANGCTCVSSATITEPIELECWVTIDNEISCYGGNDGKMTVTAGGGTPGYTFAWSNGANTAMINNLTAGTYTVTVTDANGCTCTKSMTLSDPPQLNCSVTINDHVSCFGGNDGKLTANANGGTPGYTYAWSNGANTAMISNLTAGTYTITVTDTEGCTCVSSATVNEPPALNCSVVVDNQISCAGGNDGKLTAMVSGGTPGYTFMWSNGVNTAMNPNLPAGTYTVTVTDANGCTCTKTVTLNDPPQLNCSITINNHVSCYGGNDGKLTATANGGTPGYTYAWSNGANTAMISNLSAGSYTVTVTDANGCTCVSSATITEPIELECWITVNQEISCYGGNDGKLTVTAGGGTPGYTFAWSNGANTADDQQLDCRYIYRDSHRCQWLYMYQIYDTK